MLFYFSQIACKKIASLSNEPEHARRATSKSLKPDADAARAAIELKIQWFFYWSGFLKCWMAR